MIYNIVVLDLDGTLTNSKKELSKKNKEVLIKLQEQGVKVVLASGRPTYGILPLAEELELERFGGYILSYNGAMVLECSSKRIIHSAQLPNEVIPILYRESKQAGALILTYLNENIVTEKADDKYVAIEAHLNKMKVLQVDNFLEAIPEEIIKCLSVANPEVLIPLEERLKGLLGDKISVYRSEPFFLELVPQNIDKAYSLGLLLEDIGMKREEMIAFGDGFNDLSMIRFAGCGVAMANAQQAVKDAADAIALSNDEDGVAHFLEQLQ